MTTATLEGNQKWIGVPLGLVVAVALLVAACSGGSANPTGHSGSTLWPTQWCQAQPGISRARLIDMMGKPTTDLTTQMAWSDHHYQFYAFLAEDGTVKQLDINLANLTNAEKAALPCSDTRTSRSVADRASVPAPVRDADSLPACSMVSQEEMSKILAAPVTARPSGRSRCVYQSDGANGPRVELTLERGDGAAAMQGARVASKHEAGLASPYAGIGDQAIAVGPALLIRTGNDLVTLVFSGISDPSTTAQRIFAMVKARL